MATVSAFGYSVPLAIILVFVALVVGLALAVMFWLIIVWSVYRAVRQTRRERVRPDLENALLDRMFDPEADWDRWVSTLSDVERDVVESLLDEYVPELDPVELGAAARDAWATVDPSAATSARTGSAWAS